MERHAGLFAAAVLFYVISLVEVAPDFVSPTVGLSAKACSGRTGVEHRFQGSRQTSQAWAFGLKSTSVLLTIAACAASRRTRCGTTTRSRIGMRAEVEMGSPADLFMQVLRDAAAKKGESVPVTKDVMKARKALKDNDFCMELDEYVGSVGGDEYARAEKAIELMSNLESTVFPKFMLFLSKKNRWGLLETVMDHYMRALYKTESIAPVNVVTANPLNDTEKESLKERMKAVAGASDVKMVIKVDPALVAGFKVEWDFLDPDNMLNAQQSIDMTMASHIKTAALRKGVVG